MRNWRGERSFGEIFNDHMNKIMNPKDKFTINPNKIRVRDERIKDMITSTGGVVRVFTDKKKALKADRTGRKTTKHKGADNE